MDKSKCIAILKQHNIKPTANRILVACALGECDHPTSLHELEDTIDTIDKSGIFRTIVTFKEHGLVHVIEDGSDSVKYELCHSHSHNSKHLDDMHVHFYCEACQSTICLENTRTPAVDLPPGFEAQSVNYLIKGLCPHCTTKAHLTQK